MRKVLKYNKLIRDRIPEIIKADGWKPKIRVLKNSEFFNAVKKKLQEEAGELMKAKSKKEILNEIIDIQELLDVLIHEIGVTKKQSKKMQDRKKKERGGFKKRVFLISEEKIQSKL
jgi:predicted house-cleaning noncanonical NTP pyrophosphatase (MazG superfamily)